MGRWMEIIREQPPEGQRHHTDEYRCLIMGACCPLPLMCAAAVIRTAHREGPELMRDEFPMLTKVDIRSGAYVDEDLWLAPREVAKLLEEFLLLRRICKGEDSRTGLNGRIAAVSWRGGTNPEEYETHLNEIESRLRQAVAAEAWIRLML